MLKEVAFRIDTVNLRPTDSGHDILQDLVQELFTRFFADEFLLDATLDDVPTTPSPDVDNEVDSPHEEGDGDSTALGDMIIDIADEVKQHRPVNGAPPAPSSFAAEADDRAEADAALATIVNGSERHSEAMP